MELAMRQFDDQERALQKEKEELQLKQASQNKEQQKLIQEISQLEKELAIKKKEIPATPPKLQNLRKEKEQTGKRSTSGGSESKKSEGLVVQSTETIRRIIKQGSSSLPDPKPAIAGSAPFRFLCRNGKIFPLDDKALQGMVLSNLAKAGMKPNNDKEYDGKKFLSLINGKKLSTNFFSLIGREDKDKVIRFTMERKDQAGESEENVGKAGSKYQKILSELSPQKNYLLFEVFPIALEFIWLPGTFPTKENFPPVGNRLIEERIGGVMTGVIVPWEERNISHRDPSPHLPRVNRLLLENLRTYWTSGRGIDPRLGYRS